MAELNPTKPETDLRRIAELLGNARFPEASELAGELRGKFPESAEAARLHALALLQMGQPTAACTALEKARELAPQSVDVLCNLGSALLACGDGDAAVSALLDARALAPNHPAVLNGLGNAYRAVGDANAASDAYAAATRAVPGYAGAWLNLAAAEMALGNAIESERIARPLAMQAHQPEACLLLGHALATQRRFADAEAAYLEGARLAPADARFPYQAGLMADERGDAQTAATLHARALIIDPNRAGALAELVHAKRKLCDWNGLDALSDRLRARVAADAAGIPPFAFLAEPGGPDEQLHCAHTYSAAIESNAAPLRQRLNLGQHAIAAEPRIGFISNGFGNHPTALLCVGLIECLANTSLEVHLFATTPNDASPLAQRLRTAAVQTHELAGMTDESMARHIADAGIDILIDLIGHCSGSESSMLALRPAPIQINWMAYPGSLGAPWIDYLIADGVVVPESAQKHYSEAIAWLPRCFQLTDSTRVVVEPPSRTECGLPESGVVYVCFNNSYKLDETSFTRMLHVLDAVPHSVLWLLQGPASADDNLHAFARARGIDPARLIFMAKLPHDEYLARYRHADLFLDTRNYNAHTTASDAIWAGCPVLTTPGDTFASRVAASLNAHLGMPELNVADDDAFIEFAVAIGNDMQRRAALRDELARRRADSSLFDAQGFANDFAALLRRIADRQRAGLPPIALPP